MKKAKQNNKTLKLLGKISVVVIILLLSLISFAGIYVKDKNAMKNVIPEYKLGTDLYGARNILVKVDDSTTTKKYDSNGNLVENSSEKDENNENITEVEEKVNSDELRTAENYETVKNIIEARLKYMNVEDYLLRFDESTGNISLEVPEDSSTDYIAQYTITKGEFKIVDNDTSEVLLSNADLKEAKVQYSTSTSGTTVYLTIEFNKDAVEKLKNISNTYISSTDAEGKTTTKKVKMTLDDSTIISTYFQEEISTGIIQLSMGTSTNTSEIQSNIQSASNMAVLLNTEPMPLTYTMETNRFVYSDITAETLKIVIVGLCIVALIMAICMVIKFKKNGLMGVIADIGFTAVLLLAIRYGNVEISLAGIFAIAIAVIVEYIVTGLILNEYSKKCEKEILIKNIKHLMGRIAICLVPFVVMAVTFALISWEEIASIGMILFWAIIIMIIYNTLMLVLKIFESNNGNEKNKKESNHDSKKTTMKKVIQILLICLIIAGTIVTATVGFNVGLKYSEHDEISINVGSKFNVADIKATAKEVFGNSNVLVQQVELYKDMVQITVKEATEEQITTLKDKINEKYKIENQLTDIKVVHIPNVRLRNIIKPYILPLSIVSIITIVFAMIAFRKLGVLRVAYEMAISIVAPQAILASFYAVTRIPVNRLTTIIAIMIFIISITLPMVKLDKEKEDKLNKDKKYNKI